jgi:hypothetical protein
MSTIVVVLLLFHFRESVASPSLEYIEFSIELFHGIFIGQVQNRHYFLADMGGVTGEIVLGMKGRNSRNQECSSLERSDVGVNEEAGLKVSIDSSSTRREAEGVLDG